ncbi:MAG: Smr/MutS family protein [Vicinamibacterales bacterium]
MARRQLEHDPEDEQRRFDEAMADVTPLPKDPRVRLGTFLPLPPPPRQPYRPPPERSRDDEPDDPDTDTAFVAAGVDRRTLRKLRRGQYVAARHLDLHGLTSKEALAEVRTFIEGHRGAYRCVAIVHGRGLHSAGAPVLRTAVRALLRTLHAVLAFTDAPRDDGGAGAVYILLRG